MFLLVSDVGSCPLHIVFLNDTATTEIYTYGHTLSLHDALPISTVTLTPFQTSACAREWRSGPSCRRYSRRWRAPGRGPRAGGPAAAGARDRKSTRLNSSH